MERLTVFLVPWKPGQSARRGPTIAGAVGGSQPLTSGQKKCPGAGRDLRRGWTERLGGSLIGDEKSF
jgi:hypothetical protein